MSDTIDAEPDGAIDITSCPALVVYADPASLLRVSGELDVATAPTLSAPLDLLIARGGVVGVDLSGVTFMGAAGINVVARAVARLDEQAASCCTTRPKPCAGSWS